MAEHPIQGLMQTSMENIKKMVEVNTIVGSPIQTPDGSVILPISKVGFGFAAGGSDFQVDDKGKSSGVSASTGEPTGHNAQVAMPFGGGSGGGVSITPMAFLVVGTHGVKIVSLDNQTHLVERVIDSVPQVMEKFQTMMQSKQNTPTNSDVTVNVNPNANPNVNLAAPPASTGFMPPAPPNS